MPEEKYSHTRVRCDLELVAGVPEQMVPREIFLTVTLRLSLLRLTSTHTAYSCQSTSQSRCTSGAGDHAGVDANRHARPVEKGAAEGV